MMLYAKFTFNYIANNGYNLINNDYSNLLIYFVDFLQPKYANVHYTDYFMCSIRINM